MPGAGLTGRPGPAKPFPGLIILNRCKVVNDLPFCNQEDIVDLGRISLPPLTSGIAALELVREAARQTVAHTPSSQAGLDYFASQNQNGYQIRDFCLSEFIERQMCRCFERAIYFNLLMNRQGIPCTIVGGYTIETDQDNSARATGHSLSRYDLAQLSGFDAKKGHRIYDHVWNLVYVDGRYFLVDCALTSANQEPIVAEIRKPARIPDHLSMIKVEGSDSPHRYYNANHSVTIKPLNP